MSSTTAFIGRGDPVVLAIQAYLLMFGVGDRSDTIVDEVDCPAILASQYVLPGFPEGIARVADIVENVGWFRRDFYVLGCTYFTKEGRVSDSQACITGKGFLGEDVAAACVREACEEAGLYPTRDRLRPIAVIRRGRQTFSTFATSIRDCVPYNAETTPIERLTGAEDRNNRVQLIIYGTKDDFNTLNYIRQRVASTDTRSIRGLALFNLADLMGFL
jgi:hypothetical protein